MRVCAQTGPWSLGCGWGKAGVLVRGLGEAWRCVGVLRYNWEVGAQQEAKLKFGSCKNEQQH